MTASLAPVLTPIADLLHRAWLHFLRADTRWALRDIHPQHPDRHMLEGRLAALERKLA